MRNHLLFASLIAVALAATVVAQRSDAPADRLRRPGEAEQRDAGRASDRVPGRGAGAGPERGPEPAPPPGMGPDTKLEWFMLRPGRVRLREAWSVGRVECKPWDGGANAEAEKAFVRITAVILRDAENADDKAAGVQLSLEGEDRGHTFLFDAEQLPDVLAALDALDAASQRLREAAQGSSRRAVWTLNGLEIGMNPRRTGGYLAPMSPDERSTGLSPDDFAQLRRLLEDAKNVLSREAAR